MIISIITPSFNQGQFIEQTLLSVLSQKGDFTLEYTVLDGGSTDASVSIIAHYADMIERGDWHPNCESIHFRWISQKDGGQAAALIKGLSMARGEICGWLNSDDIFLSPDVLQTVADQFSTQPDLALLTGDGVFIDEAGVYIAPHQTPRIRLKELILLDYHILQPATFFRKSVMERIQIRDHFTCAFDAEFFIALIVSGLHTRKINQPLAGFRIYPGIKTLRLASTRFREQQQIARNHCRNRLPLLISGLYRYFDIVLRPRWGHRRFFRLAFTLVRKTAYRLLLDRSA